MTGTEATPPARLARYAHGGWQLLLVAVGWVVLVATLLVVLLVVVVSLDAIPGSPAPAAGASGAAPAWAASAPAPAQLSVTQSYLFILPVVLVPAGIIAVRWLIRRRFRRLMGLDAEDPGDAGPEVSAQEGVRMTQPPRFELHDKSHGLERAIEARERFVAQARDTLRRSLWLDLAVGTLCTLLLLASGMLWSAQAGRGLDSGLLWLLALIGAILPLQAGLRYAMHVRQFRPLQARFRRTWAERLLPVGLLALPRLLLGPKLQAASTAVWVTMMVALGLANIMTPDQSAPIRALSAVMTGIAGLHPLLSWYWRRRVRAEPGVTLVVLRVFDIDANASFTFGRLLGFWRHFGSHFTVLDPSVWRHRYPLVSWRIVGGMVAATLLLYLGVGTVLAASTAAAPHVGIISASLFVVLVGSYGTVSLWRLTRRFIRSRDQIVRRLDGLARRPRHIDLSFRNFEAMCHNNTWRATVDEFTQRAQVLLMDLRGFTEANKGCQYEVDLLLDNFALDRVLFLVEQGGDLEAVRQLIQDRWAFLSPSSPNLQLRDPVASVYVSQGAGEADVQGIIDLLIHAAPRRDTATPALSAAAPRRSRS